MNNISFPTKEEKFDFRKRLAQVHVPRKNQEAAPIQDDEIKIDNTWKIVPLSTEKVLTRAAKDLQDYFQVGFGLDLALSDTVSEHCITIGISPEAHQRRCRIVAEKDMVRISGATAREAAQGCYRLEDELNLRGESYVKQGDRPYTRLYSPRMTHSGWEIETFPDEYLARITHAGMDAIILFIEDPPDITRNGKVDVNAVVEKAAEYGLDVYAYPTCHVQAAKYHPLDPEAREYYDSLYGSIIKNAPGLRGMVFVGESIAFPSREDGVAGYWWDPEKKGSKHFNGFWPCGDWVDWLELVKDVTRQYRKDLELYFWTYNWYWAPEKDRLNLLEKIPTDITVHVTFEMGDEPVIKNGVPVGVQDYSISVPGPGAVFASEAKVVSRRGIKLSSMANTAGSTWDFGVIPYMPFPFAWMKRYNNLLKAQKDWGLSGLMECHHYGFTPSFISELAKAAFTEELTVDEDYLLSIAARDFGANNAAQVVEVWRNWSDAMAYHPAREFDQYGPLRVGPVYPFVFPGEKLPPPLHPSYEIYNGKRHGCGWRHVFEVFHMQDEYVAPYLEMAEKELALFHSGNEKLRAVFASVPEVSKETALRMIALGGFIEHTIRTMRNVKRFYLNGLTVQKDGVSAADKLAALAVMRDVLADEEENVRETIPLTEYDSRLGWEPSMRYTTAPENLYWKLEQLKEAMAEVGRRCALYEE